MRRRVLEPEEERTPGDTVSNYYKESIIEESVISSLGGNWTKRAFVLLKKVPFHH